MRAGDLRHEIEIQQPVRAAADRYGRITESWETVYTVRAMIRDVSGREYLAAAAVQKENTVTFTIRWITGLDTHMRVVHGGIAYDIQSINRLGLQGDYMQLRAQAVEPEG